MSLYVDFEIIEMVFLRVVGCIMQFSYQRSVSVRCDFFDDSWCVPSGPQLSTFLIVQHSVSYEH